MNYDVVVQEMSGTRYPPVTGIAAEFLVAAALLLPRKCSAVRKENIHFQFLVSQSCWKVSPDYGFVETTRVG